MRIEAVGSTGMFGQAAAAFGRRTGAEQAKVNPSQETARLLDKDDVSLGDLNPLIHTPDLARRESIDALKKVTLAKIEKYGGIPPTKLESSLVTSLQQNTGPELRFIARFEVDTVSDEQMNLLEQLVRETYQVKVRTRTGTEGGDIRPDRYPPADLNDATLSNTTGWYMGPNTTTTDSLHKGLFVYRDLGKVNKDNFSAPTVTGSRYIVEVREATLYQTDLVEFVTQVGSILGNSERLPTGELLYEVYYDLIRLGLKGVDAQSIYGMEDAINLIKRSLILPLANRELSEGIKQQPESVLMIGVPGTGKTLAVEALLQEETGVFILPIDPFELVKELRTDKEKQTLLPRIASVSRKTGKRVILHVDDIENMVKNDEATHSTLLNLMQGIKENDFYIIASTNDPEKIDRALLQPQRFGIPIYCGLPVPEARREILSIHSTKESQQLGTPLFENDEVRAVILDAVTRATEDFTPRYIAEIANVAKSHLLNRVSQTRGMTVGLTEADLTAHQFTPEDWEKAYNEVSSRYNKDEITRRDKELRDFVDKYLKVGMGFTAGSEVSGHTLFSETDTRRLRAIHETPVTQTQSPS